MAYGPYYTSELRSIKGQQKALTGREYFSPWETEGIVRGELAARYAAERSRQSEQRNYELALARQGMEQTRLGMEAQRMRQEERAAVQAGQAQALQWGMGTWGKGLLDMESPATISTPSTPQGIATSGTYGPTQTGQTTATSGLQSATGGWGIQGTGFQRGGQAIGGFLGSLVGSQAGLVGSIVGGYGGKMFGNVVGSIATSAYNALVGPTGLFGSAVTGASIEGGVTAADAAFGGITADLGGYSMDFGTGQMGFSADLGYSGGYSPVGTDFGGVDGGGGGK